MTRIAAAAAATAFASLAMAQTYDRIIIEGPVEIEDNGDGTATIRPAETASPSPTPTPAPDSECPPCASSLRLTAEVRTALVSVGVDSCSVSTDEAPVDCVVSETGALPGCSACARELTLSAEGQTGAVTIAPGQDTCSLDGARCAVVRATADPVPKPGPIRPLPPPPSAGAFEGFGRDAAGGAGGSTCTVGELTDSALRACVEADGPRVVEFSVGGTIQLESHLVVRNPYLTVRGESAPQPGITIDGRRHEHRLIIAGTHDLILTHLRLRDLETFVIDGDTRPDRVAQDIVIDHLTVEGGNDASLDVWGEVRDVTISWTLFRDGKRGGSLSHYPAPYQTRQRISLHHNVWARTVERQPQLRAATGLPDQPLDMVNNVIFGWTWYGTRVRSNSGEPRVNANIVGNAYLPTDNAHVALVYGARPGSRDDGSLGELYVAGNRIPAENADGHSTAAEPLPVPARYQVTTWPASELASRVLPAVGTQYRTPADQAVLDEIAAAFGAAP